MYREDTHLKKYMMQLLECYNRWYMYLTLGFKRLTLKRFISLENKHDIE